MVWKNSTDRLHQSKGIQLIRYMIADYIKINGLCCQGNHKCYQYSWLAQNFCIRNDTDMDQLHICLHKFRFLLFVKRCVVLLSIESEKLILCHYVYDVLMAGMAHSNKTVKWSNNKLKVSQLYT